MFKVKSGLIVPSLMLVLALLAEPAFGSDQRERGALHHARNLAGRQEVENAATAVSSGSGGIASATISQVAETVVATSTGSSGSVIESSSVSVSQTSAVASVLASDSTVASLTSAPGSSASSTAYEIALASSIVSLAQPVSNCTSPGGGCVIFITSIADCSNDTCACDLSYPAQVCAQCIASQEAVDSYNDYLESCEAGGLVEPESTVEVEVDDCETESGEETMVGSTTSLGDVSLTGSAIAATMTNLENASAASGSASRSTALTSSGADSPIALEIGNDSSDTNSSVTGTNVSSDTSALDGVMALATDSPSDTDDDLVTTSYSTISPHAAMTVSSSLGVVGPSATALSGQMSAAQTLSGAIFTQTSQNTSTTAALDSAHAFFSIDIDASCSSDCDSWQQLAQTCTDDTCVCTSEGVSAASNCSSCIRSSSSSNSSSQLASYASFTSNCTSSAYQAGMSGSSGSGMAFGSLTTSASTNPFATGVSRITATPTTSGVNVAEVNGGSTTTVTGGSGFTSEARKIGVSMGSVVSIVAVVGLIGSLV
ncbi:hypothetical protein L198_06388 [Cryptococcus wingfieldii CBS 7118]|uniref:Extracellular membrane protein CFEM domain-containing protein n=1 Tax=Cryptococcus wingfieldii CBS 7118 TaxID=1295528 RepID=A0A1E3IM70_9TREE|nr:hypothetical protein L198_06388 [Cryptococcus wingfieldii CBS 7118]ODN89697.1 hypothetical protein L198_06388 [Cryptococcus wingfieldii CBS 7118]